MPSKLESYQLSIFATLFIGYACYAYNRKSVSFAIPKLMEDGLDKSQVGLIVSCQNVAYAISKFLGGVLSDRISSRLLFSTGLTVSGLATLLFSGSSSVTLFSALWFLNGFAQGCGWPACAKMLRKWYSPEQFGTWWSVLSASANISGGVSPFISVFLIVNYGWRFSLVVAGLVSVVLGLSSLLVLVNSPEDVGLPGFSVKQSKSEGSENKDKDAGVMDLVKSPMLWLVSFCYMVVFCGKTSAVDWGQLYFMEDRKRTQYVGSAFTSSVETGGFFGGIVAGYMTDWALRTASKNGGSSKRGNPRMAVAVYFMAGVAACLHLLQFSIADDTSEVLISLLGFVLGACFYGPIAIYGVVAAESAPPHLSGTAHAIVALAANVGAIISGLPFSYVAKYYNWSTIFFILEVATAFTVFVMIACRNFSSKMAKTKSE